MGLPQIFASILAALLIGVLTPALTPKFFPGALRTYLLLVFSVLAVFWFQPVVPLRSFDFWFPFLTLALVLLTWFVTSNPGAWKSRHNLIGLFIVIGLATLVDISRYVFPNPIITGANPPQFNQYLIFSLVAVVTILAVYQLSINHKWVLTFSIVLLIATLVVLKYSPFSLRASIFFRTLADQSVETASAMDLRWFGYSYIAFRLVHVLRDKQTGRLPELSLPDFATYVVFFPSLAAGPIDRAERFAKDLQKDFRLTQDETLLAGQRIVTGLFKKFVLADSLALIALNDALASQVHSGGWMWIHLYAYTFQIYLDFSGYTDIAIGIGLLAGIRLPENFLSPYTKPNLAQFWNSWHITLTQWIRSYFFNPFNRWVRRFKSVPMWGMILVGQLSTMLLIGMWHGIAWNFVLWGAWHGLGLFLQNRWSDFTKTRFNTSNARTQSIMKIGSILLTFHFVALGWVFFALSEPGLSVQVFMKLFGVQ